MVATVVTAAGVTLGACSTDSAAPTTTAPPTVAATEPIATAPPTTEPPTTVPPTTAAPTTIETTTTTTVPPTTLPPTTVETTTTVAAVPVAGQPNPACIVGVLAGDSMNLIVERIADPAVGIDAVVQENGIADANVISVGQQLDVCPGNGIDDLTGGPRVPPTTAPPAPSAPDTPDPAPLPVDAFATGVPAQQQKLNDLFGPYGTRPLTVDGDSGRMTRQLLCAARVALGMPVSREDMAPGGAEEQALMAATGLPVPPGAPTWAGRWGLIDQHCQVLFVGQGSDDLVFVFPTSTGQGEFPTRLQDAARVFRYDPARANGGWHNSIDYPVGDDNPLNGNMYKPLYFDRGQAIHGANTVPTSPASHGCARLRVGDQDALVSWLGLDDQGSQLWNGIDRIGFTVSIVGRY